MHLIELFKLANITIDTSNIYDSSACVKKVSDKWVVFPNYYGSNSLTDSLKWVNYKVEFPDDIKNPDQEYLSLIAFEIYRNHYPRWQLDSLTREIYL